MIRRQDLSRRGWRCLTAALLLLGLALGAVADGLQTPAEKNRYNRYSQTEDIEMFLSALEQASDTVRIRIIGRTGETRTFRSRNLYLAVLTESGVERQDQLDRTRPTVLFVASQHGNEQSAKEAVLWLMRDLAVGDLMPLLAEVNVLIIPTANPYGNLFDQRRNEQDLDLNRDHVKLESPEVEAIHAVFRDWMPEATIDVHEKGDDYYRVSIGCVSNANISPSLQTFSRENILSEVKANVEGKGFPFHEYLVSQPMGIDSSAGVTYRSEDVGRRETMRRFSTTDLNDGRNSLGIYESLSFIQEGASRHDIPTLEDRTTWQYWGLRSWLESVARHGEEINEMVRGLRNDLREKAASFDEKDLVHLRMMYAKDEGWPELNIKRFERSPSNILGLLRVDKKAGDALRAADVRRPDEAGIPRVVDEVVKNWFPLVQPTRSVGRPLGYIVPARYEAAIETLLKHRIRVDIFTKGTLLNVEAYTIKDIAPAEYDYLPPQKIILDKTQSQTLAEKGDFFISCGQPAANLIPNLLEPEAQYGLIRYRAYDLVPEAGEVFPILRSVVGTDSLPVLPYLPWRR